MEHLFNKTCDIFDYSQKPEWNMSELYMRKETVKCRLRLLRSNEVIEGQKKKIATHRIYLPATANIEPSDKLFIDGVKFEIITIPNNAGGNINHHLEVDVRAYEKRKN